MRSFLPTKGPGGRTLTPLEKGALVVLALTLVLCVLTLLAGESAFHDVEARNPVFGLVALLSRAIGGGIVGFYALILVWSGLLYFKGQSIADITPVGGRLVAIFAVTVGISGALGIAQIGSAGALGSVVGGALGGTLGGTGGIVVLLALMLLGINLAGQGAWFALREPTPVVASSAGAHAIPRDAGGRITTDAFLPDDGDPSPDERSRAVTQAMEEIERSHGVTIVDVETPTTPEPVEDDEVVETRSSIGEQVEAAPHPSPGTEEAEIQQGLQQVSETLDSGNRGSEGSERLGREEEGIPHPFSPAPPQEAAYDDEDPEAATRVYYPSYQLIEGREKEQDEPPDEEAEEAEEPEEVPERESGFAATGAALDDDDAEAEQVEEEEEEDEEVDRDPYARGGLIKRLQENQEEREQADAQRPYASFDWRGRPLD